MGGGAWKLTEDRLENMLASRRAGFWRFTWLCLTCFQLLSSSRFCCCLFLHCAGRETKAGLGKFARFQPAEQCHRWVQSQVWLPGQNSPSEVHGDAGRREGRLGERQHPLCLIHTYWNQQSLPTDFNSQFSRQNSFLRFVTQHSFSVLYSDW